MAKMAVTVKVSDMPEMKAVLEAVDAVIITAFQLESNDWLLQDGHMKHLVGLMQALKAQVQDIPNDQEEQTQP